MLSEELYVELIINTYWDINLARNKLRIYKPGVVCNTHAAAIVLKYGILYLKKIEMIKKVLKSRKMGQSSKSSRRKYKLLLI